mmetsp:Transcript_8326/g.24442  ORF Transcript_8326/g.24442 Transcript_8326/m.24442 type:complete len:238 (+) Transcript_8326:113-826(+)
MTDSVRGRASQLALTGPASSLARKPTSRRCAAPCCAATPRPEAHVFEAHEPVRWPKDEAERAAVAGRARRKAAARVEAGGLATRTSPDSASARRLRLGGLPRSGLPRVFRRRCGLPDGGDHFLDGGVDENALVRVTVNHLAARVDDHGAALLEGELRIRGGEGAPVGDDSLHHVLQPERRELEGAEAGGPHWRKRGRWEVSGEAALGSSLRQRLRHPLRLRVLVPEEALNDRLQRAR